MSEMVHVVWSFHKKKDILLKVLHTSILSVLLNTKHKIFIHVLCDELFIDKERMDLRNTVEKEFQQKIEFYDVDLDSKLLDVAPMFHTKGTYYRLMISEYIRDVRKIIYLDYDVIVDMDISLLYNLEFKNKKILAQYDPISKNGRKSKVARYFKKRDIDIKKYFNAGILLIDITCWNCEKMLKSMIPFFEKFPYCRFSDQDFLNFYFKKEWGPFPENINIFSDEYDANIQKACWHFAGNIKPWNYFVGGVDKIYWKYYYHTMFCRNIEAFLEEIPCGLTIEDDLSQGKQIGKKSTFLKKLIQRVYKGLMRRFSFRTFEERKINL